MAERKSMKTLYLKLIIAGIILAGISSPAWAEFHSENAREQYLHADDDGACGNANGQTLKSQPTDPNDLCAAGYSTGLTGNETQWSWTCYGNVSNTGCAALKADPEPFGFDDFSIE